MKKNKPTSPIILYLKLLLRFLLQIPYKIHNKNKYQIFSWKFKILSSIMLIPKHCKGKNKLKNNKTKINYSKIQKRFSMNHGKSKNQLRMIWKVQKMNPSLRKKHSGSISAETKFQFVKGFVSYDFLLWIKTSFIVSKFCLSFGLLFKFKFYDESYGQFNLWKSQKSKRLENVHFFFFPFFFPFFKVIWWIWTIAFLYYW